MNPEVLITVLTSRRPRYLRRTLSALERNVFREDLLRTWIFVNGADPATIGVINRYRPGFDRLFLSPENLGQVPALNRLWRDLAGRRVLHVEDDMVAERGGWLESCLEFLDRNPEVGQLRLYPFWGVYHISRINLVTRRAIEFESPQKIGDEQFSLTVEPAHFAFVPSLINPAALEDIVPIEAGPLRDQAENYAQRIFHQRGWRTAQMHDAPFRHIGRRSVFGGWGVGFGLHPTTRLGKFRLQTYRLLVGLAKKLLGR